ncbi:anhydro-N-acetylmuramic acid kinase, partial [Photobacterium iliopiscarium]|uniref:anhydro-N-acetylmuramic acid kinase n=1 Tax=Photobacterium iliopiscarium TaxID=56192 RepID=UPI002430A3C0
MEKYIGLMSGTSMDGVDAVLVKIDNNNIRLLGSHPFAMGNNLKQSLLDICLGQPTNLQTLGELDHRLGHLFADAVLALLNKTQTDATDITAIGSHGQTVFHSPHTEYAFTMQIGDANIIAAKTGITTVADFRRKDMAFGGQGAPLV